MAVIKVGNNSIGKISVIEPYDDPIGFVETPTSTWTRPDYWLDMPVINSGEHKCAFLLAVPSGGFNQQVNSYMQVVVTGTRDGASNNYFNDYTIEWGDGNTEVVNHYGYGQVTTHDFDFDSLNPNTQFTHDGTLYRQSLVTIDANSGIYSLDWKRTKTGPTGQNQFRPVHNVLEFNLNLPSAISVDSNSYNGSSWSLPLLRKAKVYAPQAEYLSSLFQNAINLQDLDMYSGSMPNLTGVPYLFDNCGLKTLPAIDTSNVTNFRGTFSKLKNVSELPSGLYDFSSATVMHQTFAYSDFKSVYVDVPSSVTNMNNCFLNCDKLKTVTGSWDTSNVTAIDQIFGYCFDLVYCPDVSFDSATNLNWAFINCYNIRKLPTVRFENATTARGAFSNCRSVTEVDVDLSNPNDNIIYYDGLFNGCSSLKKINFLSKKILNRRTTGVHTMFAGCASLVEIPDLDLSGVPYFYGMFSSCNNLRRVGQLNTPDGTNFTYMFDGCYSLEEIPAFDITAGGTGNVNMNRAFRSTMNLKEFPKFDYSRVTYAQELYSGSSASGEIDVDLSNQISNGNMFFNAVYNKPTYIRNLTLGSNNLNNFAYSNNHLISIPYADASNVTNLTGAFNYCTSLEVGALSGTSVSIGYFRTGMSSGAVLDVINGLASGVTGQTIDLRNCYGVYYLSDAEKSIAENKGWTVTT